MVIIVFIDSPNMGAASTAMAEGQLVHSAVRVSDRLQHHMCPRRDLRICKAIDASPGSLRTESCEQVLIGQYTLSCSCHYWTLRGLHRYDLHSLRQPAPAQGPGSGTSMWMTRARPHKDWWVPPRQWGSICGSQPLQQILCISHIYIMIHKSSKIVIIK